MSRPGTKLPVEVALNSASITSVRGMGGACVGGGAGAREKGDKETMRGKEGDKEGGEEGGAWLSYRMSRR